MRLDGNPYRRRSAKPLALVAVAFALSGCCAHRGYDEAVTRQRALEAAVVRDRNPSASPAAGCMDALLVDVSDLARGLHEGELIALDAEPAVAPIRRCTQMLCEDECGTETPCCNDCSGEYRLVLPGNARVSVSLQGKDLQCGGPSCAMQCSPFGTRPGRRYRFIGRYEIVSSGEGAVSARLHVDRWCAAP